MKTCTQCKIQKPFVDFSKRKNRKDGHCSWCKSCYAKKNLLRKNQDLETHKIKAKKYYEDNKDILKMKRRIYMEKNKEIINLKRRLYYEANKERILKRVREYHKKWRATERGKILTKINIESGYLKYPKHRQARIILGNALKLKKITKPSQCTLCLSSDKIEAHHPNYDEPLNVVWLCRKCHMAIHKSIKEASNASKRIQQEKN